MRRHATIQINPGTPVSQPQSTPVGTDVHTLYDRGYLGIDADLRLRMSPELRAPGWNGVEFYEREAAGFRITVPEAPDLRLDRDALDWHFTTRFRAA